jgi:hypothetical protein
MSHLMPSQELTDELVSVLARIIIIGIGVAYYDEVVGLLILLVVALLLLDASVLSDGQGGKKGGKKGRRAWPHG